MMKALLNFKAIWLSTTLLLSFIILMGIGVSGGNIDNQGTMIIKGNLNTQSTTPMNLGPGTFEFSGTTPQTISGPNIFTNLTINNGAGVSLTGSYDNQVNGTLTLTSGLLTLGSLNLLMGPVAVVAASPAPTASNMVVADGTGELRKAYSGIGSFIFPVGDNTGTAEYSPVTLNFTSGTFATGAYAGVNLVDAVYPDPKITVDYLTRYWTATQSGITSFNCNAQFDYIGGAADVVGNESNICCVKIAPPPIVTYNVANTGSHFLTATGLTSLSTFTGMRAALQTQLYVMLEGPFNSGTNLMKTTLNSGGKLPLSQPYNNSDVPPASTYYYNGSESVGSIPNADIVDWVLVQLRQATTQSLANASAVFVERAGFLKKDGSIVDIDGSSNLRFDNAAISSGNNLYIVVRHRNHMAVMSANAVVKNSNGIYDYNYTTGSAQVYKGVLGCKQLQTTPSIWGLVAGEGNYDNNILPADFSLWSGQSGLNNGYFISDYNMDLNVLPADFTLWSGNSGYSNQIP